MPKDKVDWINIQDSTQPQYIYPGEIAVTGRMVASRIFTLATAPTINNDGYDTAGLGQNFYNGDWWNDTLNGRIYKCESNSPCSAAWTLVGSQDGIIGTKETDETDLGDGGFPWYNSATGVFEYGDRWDDLRFPFQQAVRAALIKPDYDEVNIGLLFPQNVVTEYVLMIAQMPHSYKIGSDVSPHVHYVQTVAAVPTFTLEYRWYDLGDTIPAFATIQTTTTPVVTTAYSATRHQKLSFPDITGAGITGISSIIDMKLYRDDNVVVGDILFKELDIHYILDSIASEFPGSKT